MKPRGSRVQRGVNVLISLFGWSIDARPALFGRSKRWQEIQQEITSAIFSKEVRLITTVEKQAQNAHRKQRWPLCIEEIEHGGPTRVGGIEDFLLGRFDEECLSDDPPESDWNDWFPPPPKLSWDELGLLAEWVDEQADKHSLWPDPELYPLSFFEGEEHEWLFLM